jgi:hypothetical protein
MKLREDIENPMLSPEPNYSAPRTNTVQVTVDYAEFDALNAKLAADLRKEQVYEQRVSKAS